MNWTGRVVAICASGPSMRPHIIDAVRAAGLTAIVINDTWRLMPDAAVLVAADRSWWTCRDPRSSPTDAEFAGERICCDDKVPGTAFVKPTSRPEGGNSAMHAARDVAAARGARAILLFGVDLRDDELTHWHGRHAALNNPTAPRFARARAAWGRYAAVADRPLIINCNPRSGLTCFERMTFDEAMNAVQVAELAA